jgi:hypothetical protein
MIFVCLLAEGVKVTLMKQLASATSTVFEKRQAVATIIEEAAQEAKAKVT